MMFINPQTLNEGDLMASTNGTIYTRPYDTTGTGAIQLQSTNENNSFANATTYYTQQQQQKQPLNVPFSNNNLPTYATTNTNFMFSTTTTNAQAIPFNLAFFNHPALSCNFNQTHATPILQPYTQLSAIPNYTNHPLLSKKYTGPIKTDYSYSNSCAKTKPYQNKPLSSSSITNTATTPSNTSLYQNRPHTDATALLTPSYTTPNTTPVYTAVSNLALHPTTAIPLLRVNSNTLGIKRRKNRYKKPLEMRNVLPKNPLMLLHELRPNVEYHFVSQNGPIHRPIFTMSVNIEQHMFEGVGKTKKEARMLAADKALKFLMENPEYIIKKKEKTDTSTSASGSGNEKLDDSLNEKSDVEEDDDSVDDADSESYSQAKRLKIENTNDDSLLPSNHDLHEVLNTPESQ